MRTTTLFPLGAIAISIISYLHPGLLLPFKGYIVPLLGLVMLGMGMTLRPEDFRNVLRTPKPVTLGVALQFILMPFMAWLIAESMGLPLELVLGMGAGGLMPGGYRIEYHLLPGKRRGCRIHYPDSRVHTAGGIPDAAADLVLHRAKSPGAGAGHDAEYLYHHPGAGYPGGVHQLPFR